MKEKDKEIDTGHRAVKGVNAHAASPVVDESIKATRKYIFVVGGVCSSVGKGITAASVGRLLKSSGFKTVIQKLDPYLNVDAGTMSPTQHGEVFVTDDGGEVDLDLGHYERFIDENLGRDSSVTMGQVYQGILGQERAGEYLGRTVQVIPHVTDEIKRRILDVGEMSNADCVIVECGGTVGDIEAGAPLEAIRQLQFELPQRSTAVIFVSYVPFLDPPGELKTKPTQLATHLLQQSGIRPDLVVARMDRGKYTDEAVSDSVRKIALFAGLKTEAVIPMPPMDFVYEVPLALSRSVAWKILQQRLGLPDGVENLGEWEKVVSIMKRTRESVKVAIVCKYMQLEDSYISLYEALKAAGVVVGRNVQVESLDSVLLENGDQAAWERLKQCSGIIIPGGFGTRGMEGKIATARYASENGVPYLGICLGMHTMAVALARQALEDDSITSQEFDVGQTVDQEKYVIHYLPGQKDADKGGSMRLGGYDSEIVAGSRLADIYGIPAGGTIRERHRHRLEFNNTFRDALQRAGVVFSGIFSRQSLVEAMELQDHPFMIGVQYHPELISRPNKPHPLFVRFLRSAMPSD